MIIGLALNAHIDTLVVRQEGTQLSGIKNRLFELMEKGDRWKGIGPHGGELRTVDGRRVELLGCQNFQEANAKLRGRPHDLKAWDELPTIRGEVYRFVNGWNRTHHPDQRCRIIGAGNPPARPEEEWVLNYWKPWLRDFTASPGELRWFAVLDGEDKEVESGEPFYYKKELVYPRSRTFIPALLSDNEILEKSGYRQVLQHMEEPYRTQMLYGNMTIGLRDGIHQLIPTKWVDMAFRRWKEKPISQRGDLTCIAIDPARGGADRSVMCKRYTNYIDTLRVLPGQNTPNGPELVKNMFDTVEYIYVPIIIDITGSAGGGVYDTLTLMSPHLRPHAFVASAKSEYRTKSGLVGVRNKRTEAYYRLHDALNPENGFELALPPDDELRAEITSQERYISGGVAYLLEKDEIIKKVGKSPDKSDAVAMAFMDQDATGGWVVSHTPDLPEHTFLGADNRKHQHNPWGF